MSSTKLLFITSEFPPQPGGIGTHAFHVAQHLSKHEVEVTLLTNQRSEDGVEEKSFDALQTYNIHRIARQRLLIVSYFSRIRKGIQLSRKQDVLLFSGKFSLWIGGLLTLSTSKKTIAVIHGSEVLLNKSWLRSYTNWCLKRFDHVVAVSKYTLSLVAHLDIKETSVIPNGFDVVKSAHFRKEKPTSLQLITVGNVTQRKGQHNVVKSLPGLLNKYPDLKYHIVGLPTNQMSLQELANQLGVGNHIQFHGRVSEQQKTEFLKQASIFIMLSEETNSGDVEGFGIAILEANAFGVPAIGSTNCGIEDAILEGKSGRLIPYNDVEACQEAIAQILSNYQYFSNEAAKWTKNFQWPIIIREYVTLIKDK